MKTKIFLVIAIFTIVLIFISKKPYISNKILDQKKIQYKLVNIEISFDNPEIIIEDLWALDTKGMIKEWWLLDYFWDVGNFLSYLPSWKLTRACEYIEDDWLQNYQSGCTFFKIYYDNFSFVVRSHYWLKPEIFLENGRLVRYDINKMDLYNGFGPYILSRYLKPDKISFEEIVENRNWKKENYCINSKRGWDYYWSWASYLYLSSWDYYIDYQNIPDILYTWDVYYRNWFFWKNINNLYLENKFSLYTLTDYDFVNDVCLNPIVWLLFYIDWYDFYYIFENPDGDFWTWILWPISLDIQ